MYRPTAVIFDARNATVVVLASHEALRRSRCLAGERLLSVFAGAVKRTSAESTVPISGHLLSRFAAELQLPLPLECK
jgi:hypothetical protein